MNERPILWYFVPVREMKPSEDGKRLTFQEIVHTIIPLPGERFPVVRDDFSLFAVLTNGRGTHTFNIELSVWEFDGDFVLGTRPNPPITINLGTDPTVVHGLPIPKFKLIFSQPGQYTLRLRCDGQPLAGEARIRVRAR